MVNERNLSILNLEMYLSFSSVGLAHKAALIQVGGMKQPKNWAFPLFAWAMNQKFLKLSLVFDKRSYFFTRF